MQVHADDRVPPGRAFLRGPAKAIVAMRDRNVDEAGILKQLDELCFQQSACDSTRPEVEVAQRVVRQGFTDDDVGHLHAAAGLEDAGDLGDRALLLGNEVEDAVRDHHIDRPIVDRQPCRVAAPDLDVIEAARRRPLARARIDSVMSTPIARPPAPTWRAASSKSVPAPQPMSTTVAPTGNGPTACGFPTPANEDVTSLGNAASSLRSYPSTVAAYCGPRWKWKSPSGAAATRE